MKKSILVSILMFILLSVSGYVSGQSKKETLKTVLEEFCRKYYSDCFEGRTYVQNTLVVDDYSVKEDNLIKVSGTHSYRGRYGSLYEEMDFYVYITTGSNYVTFEFHKKAKADFFHSKDYWEECTKKVYE